jgi:hypothetical protein
MPVKLVENIQLGELPPTTVRGAVVGVKVTLLNTTGAFTPLTAPGRTVTVAVPRLLSVAEALLPPPLQGNQLYTVAWADEALAATATAAPKSTRRPIRVSAFPRGVIVHARMKILLRVLACLRVNTPPGDPSRLARRPRGLAGKRHESPAACHPRTPREPPSRPATALPAIWRGQSSFVAYSFSAIPQKE